MLGSSSADVETWRGEGWRTDFSRATVPLGEILFGGPPPRIVAWKEGKAGDPPPPRR